MAAPQVGLTVIKRMQYRADAGEEYSNHYWLTGSTPSDSAAWRTLFDALVVEEKKVHNSATQTVGGYGYDSTSDDRTAVWSVDLTISPNTPVNGTFAPGGGDMRAPGDAAVWVRWGLDRFANGKRIYLRKYFHPAYFDTSAGADYVAPDLVTALTAFGAKMHDGTFAGSRLITDTRGTAVVGHAVSPYVTTRTLKRRGKRPPT